MMEKKIVAIDDSNILLMSIENILKNYYEIACFIQPQRALKYLNTHVPDLILLDIDMPELNGYEVLQLIKAQEHLKNVKVLFLTSNADKQHVMEAIKAGADGYLAKPIDENTLITKIKEAI